MEEILVHIPYWKKKAWFPDVIDAWLGQSHKNFRLLITNDGDTDSPERWLRKDSRITHFRLTKNHGRYFADQVALQANPYRYYCVSDADDIPEPERLEKLLMLDTPVRLAHQRVVNGNREWVETPKTLFRTTMHIRYIGHFAGVYDTEALKGVGGFHPGFRVGYDSLIVNLLKIARYKIGVIPEILHTRYIRPESLITATDTGWRSSYREQQRKLLTTLYRRCVSDPTNIKNIIEADIDIKMRREVARQVRRLEKILL